jgi:RimJ/RimL family protein N-acetyltransferase
MEIIIRQIEIEDKNKLLKLIKNTEKTLTNKKLWLPIKEKVKDNLFNKNFLCFLGAFDNNKLIAASALFFDEFEYKDTVKAVDLKSDSIAEIGRCMVDFEHRGKNLMFTLNTKLLDIAKKKKIKDVVATVHPKNVSSYKSLQKLGMKKIGTITKSIDFTRDVYHLNLNSM